LTAEPARNDGLFVSIQECVIAAVIYHSGGGVRWHSTSSVRFVTGSQSNVFDAKVKIIDGVTSVFDGAAHVKNNSFDGIARVKDSATEVIDGRAHIYYSASDFFDGKAFIFQQTVEVSGYYLLDDIVDLGGVFQSRLTASITAGGMDLQSNLYDETDLYAVSNLYGNIEGLFSVGIELSTTNDDPLVDPEWSEWRSFLVGDYSARAFRFRIAMSGTYPNVTPVVSAVAIQIDMPDRVVGFDAVVLTTGTRVEFDPPFYVTPKIGIAVIDGVEGDKYLITNQDESGFDIAFTNGGSPVERNISGIAKAYGSLEE
jgi:hypothetical protein